MILLAYNPSSESSLSMAEKSAPPTPTMMIDIGKTRGPDDGHHGVWHVRDDSISQHQ